MDWQYLFWEPGHQKLVGAQFGGQSDKNQVTRVKVKERELNWVKNIFFVVEVDVLSFKQLILKIFSQYYFAILIPGFSITKICYLFI